MKESKKEINYEKFSLGLALFDALPVLFFSLAMILIAANYNVTVFVVGAICVAAAGLGKVIWKIIIAATSKDIRVLNRQMRYLMPVGFVLMIIGMIVGMKAGSWAALAGKVFSFPAIIFFIITFAGMVMMSVFAGKLDSTKASSNWTEQITNAIAQGAFLIGVWCCLH